MSSSRLIRLLKWIACKSGQFLADCIQLVAVDHTPGFGKNKYRKKGTRMRPIIHRTINNTRTIIVKSQK